MTLAFRGAKRIAIVAGAGVLFSISGSDPSVRAQAKQNSPQSQNSNSKSQSAPAGARRQRVSNPLNDLLAEAQRNIEKKEFAAAVDPLQKFIAEQPDVAYGHFQLGYVYTALEKVPEARGEYERAIALDPKMTEAYLNLGILLLDRDPAAAVPNLQKAVELLPSQSRPRYLLGVAKGRSGDIAGAAESFEGAYRLEPSNNEPIVHLANLYVRLKRYSDGEAKFRSLLETQPDNAAALLGLAQCLDAQKKAEAADAYRNYLRAQPGDAAARGRLVRWLIDQQQYDEALGELDRASAGKTPDSDLLRMRADIEIAQKKWAEAVKTLNQAIALAPKDPELHGGLGRIYLQTREFPAAEKELKVAIQMDGRNLAYLKDLGTAYYLAGDCPATLATLEVIAKSETPGAGPWFVRALCYDKLNQTQAALDAYQKFLSLDQGQNADQEWQAQERSKVLRKALERKR